MIKLISMSAIAVALLGCNSSDTVAQTQTALDTQTVVSPTQMPSTQPQAYAISYTTAGSAIAKSQGANGLKESLAEAKKYWFVANTPKGITPPSMRKESNTSLFDSLQVGFGGPGAYDFISEDESETIWMSSIDLALNPHIADNGYYQKIKNFNGEDFTKLQEKLKGSKYITFWLTSNWEEWWFSAEQIQKAMDEGYVPVFIYWYFGDHLIYGMPSSDEVDAYHQNNEKLSHFLAQFEGEKMIIMEPEFNKPAVLSSEENQEQFASILSTAIDTVKVDNDSMLVSLCMTDAGSRDRNTTASYCGYDNCALGDKNSWNRPELIFNKLSDKLDFISFQQVIAQFSRDPSDPGSWDEPNPIAYTESSIGINLLPERINNMSAFLHEKYNKPVFLPYMTVATATWDDTNSNNQIDSDELDLAGWDEKVATTYLRLSELKSELHSNGLFGYAPMALFDHPGHDKGGYQYFMNNEYHLGIIKTNADETVDNHLYGTLEEKANILDFIY